MAWRCAAARRLMRQAFAGEPLSARQATALWRELGRCDACRAAYERVTQMNRWLGSPSGRVDKPVAAELLPFAARVLNHPDVRPAPGRRLEAWVRKLRRRARSPAPWHYAAWAAMAACALMLIVTYAGREHAAIPPMQPRAGGVPALAVRVFCRDATGVTPAREQGALLICAHDATALFATIASEAGEVSAFVERDGQLVAATDTPVHVEPTLQIESFPMALAAAPDDGDQRLLFVLGDTKVTAEEAEALLSAAARAPEAGWAPVGAQRWAITRTLRFAGGATPGDVP